MKPIEIIGAGLAGLALGNALQGSNVPVTLHEAGTLPRHRVCGEFICGRGAEALHALGLSNSLEGACLHRSTAWYIGGKKALEQDLPKPALGLSRFMLDQRLASDFETAGGKIKLNSRKKTMNDSEGIVLCHGRTPTRSDWIGLKLHCRDLSTQADLELHLSGQGYVGLSKIENGQVNVCALFKRSPALKAKGTDCLIEYLKHHGLSMVAERLAKSEIIPGSHCGVAGVEFSRIPSKHDRTTIRLGDAYSVIPPFTGNGMSIALECAQLAYPILLEYSSSSMSWQSCVERIHKAQRKTFDNRLRAARWVHPYMHTATGQSILSILARSGLLPFSFLYSITH